ncbi:MAG: NAD-dependent epimerase/dehydratase family protein [Nitrospirae bacterium]|nr:NAD-dependent epimerase/dehydratase family protein [Nitrospirota bacterium]
MATLVTGGAGFIGSHLIERLLKEREKVVCIDDFNDYYNPRIKRANIQPFLKEKNFRLYEADIRDSKALSEVFETEDVQSVVHLAARAGIRDSLTAAHLYAQVNICGTLNLLEEVKKKGVRKFIFGSSSSVYGLSSRIPFREDDPADTPISPYAATKRAGELLCYSYHQLYHIPITILRFFTVYGPRGRPEMAIYKFARLIDEGGEIPLYGDGTSQRDYTYISDSVQGITSALQENFSFEIFNLGGGKTVELKQMISLLEKSLKKKAKIKYCPEQPGDVYLTSADISKARKLLKYSPRVPLKEGIERFIQWYHLSGQEERE